MMHHPNIVKLKEVFEDRKFMYIVLEYMKGGELFDYVKRKKNLSEPETALIIY